MFSACHHSPSMPRHIIITGASQGIGEALAKAYAGPEVVLGLIARNSDSLQLVSEACSQLGAKVMNASIDVNDSIRLKTWIDTFDQRHPIDLVIANAGVTNFLGIGGEPESWEATRKVLDTNICGVVNTIYPLLKKMQIRGSGQIAIVSSLAAYRGMSVSPAYCASKAAIKCYGEALREWLKPFHVTVSVICPGFVQSPMSDQFPGLRLLMISAEKAASIIQRGLARNQACIAFPFTLHLGMKLLQFLPSWFADHVFAYLHNGQTYTPPRL